MAIEATLKISNVVGEVSRSKDFKGIDRGNFLRSKVRIDLSLLLCCGQLISLENGKQIWVGFKYERFPNLCYWCGRLTHNDRDYEMWIESEGTLMLEERQFGLGLRAPTFIITRKAGLTVPGYYEARKKNVSSSAYSAMEADNSGHDANRWLEQRGKEQ